MATSFKSKLTITGICLLHIISAFSQNGPATKGIRFSSVHTSFPDSARARDYIYDSIHYLTPEHYSDNSVLLIVPEHLDRKRKVDLVFWFHGWHNNIDTAVQFYEIEKQFLESKKNAVLVLAETAKNAPDSYGGKLEQKGVFKGLVGDVITKLKQEKILGQKASTGSIILAGHSGAYRVIAYILANGEIPVAEVDLFDALYGQTDKYLSWIEQDKSHRFVNWYTNKGGGTDEVSVKMMEQLDTLRLPYLLVEESSVSPEVIRTNRILFVHSPREHNVIINRPDNLKLLLENSAHLKFTK